jgi:hypothetical protein
MAPFLNSSNFSCATANCLFGIDFLRDGLLEGCSRFRELLFGCLAFLSRNSK